MKTRIKWLLPAFFAALLLAALQPAQAAGVTDTEIRIGNIMPYTGPLAAFAFDRQGGGRLFRHDQ